MLTKADGCVPPGRSPDQYRLSRISGPYLRSEGIRSLLSLYRDYLDLDKHGDSFKPFLLPTDDSVQSHVARSYFERLPMIRELMGKVKVEDEH